MLTIFRHIIAILFLPFLAAGIIPYWLLITYSASDSRWGDSSIIILLVRIIGIICFIAGFGLFSWCIRLFAKIGKGTLAPWDPTCNLVVVGPYRYVRNPMICGVTLMLIGQALWWGSYLVSLWTGIFIIINHLYFILVEEPGLEKRFGKKYCMYKANVARWIPRLKSWIGN